MYGQNREDDIIVDLLSKLPDGSYAKNFIDCGAFDPKTFSNTRLLVEAGWSGTYVEPAPGNFNRFLTEYRDNDKLTLVNAALTHESRLVEFWDSGGDAVSSLVPEHVAKWSADGRLKFKKYLTKTITWDELLNATNIDDNPVSVLSLDVESLNVDLFKLMFMGDRRPIDRLLPGLRIFSIEHDYHHEEMAAVLLPYGFTMHHFNGENAIFVR